ncbi:3-deoxy-7-phosphoheptulonate synthase [Geobacter sulfurreducens]|jgi:3-deoxy-7-phosphoheptulonate synthase|uniref:Phospho-2-dehydro-3-deoxyheptonate aldolase n=1 Tax=Geobacter sulfurreducens (strain ATCC 51573 / DSM 12127 / PCA) TaxID=243231 RepID=Q74AR1_GEOSL|nr:3-deoxy-7-phosphoheptulonate synthase [Geobacter sulfurreducens]AAR35667.1 3-deoxy-D-arabino-heptulosonate 7-phosphate synthase [Geobacter sulfurreducens PCA]ADI85051.1 3-deoxy-D-arabino-heptulosonate 7-phosphate synthase [Geobacter sulfurreducens KN400]AJY68520.1 phospho-2-dehydro-3-deoxyheptonate aldolase [Geobacter sulfurreducens]QVW34142.1 3-deoxy-7-phosphoheptulonate synthase [Geobacter sulfurreducens]UAC03003.1 3-deoxy-7-phosphoheptulonate synthase [Geobacter sulfurreducens]
MIRTSNLKIKSITPIIAPGELRQVFPQSEEAAEFVNSSRAHIKNILKGKDPRLMVVVGPCSIHDPKSALEYAGRLARLAAELSDQLFIVMRVYFEKPRTTVGWKGLINDPDMNGTHQISKGLGIARRLLSEITEMLLPVATEMLDPITPDYLADCISWGAIGARTTESQTHREMASGLSFPVGFKNGTDGNLQIAIDAMNAALHSHSFLGVNREGRTSIIQTTGNPDVHIVLRGGKKPNYFPEDIRKTEEMLEKGGLFPTIMVDCSHGNSEKRHEKQPDVLSSVVDQIAAGNRSISGVMIESFLEEGNQSIPRDLSTLKYGVSITDKCIDWKTTETILRSAHDRLKAAGGRPLHG